MPIIALNPSLSNQNHFLSSATFQLIRYYFLFFHHIFLPQFPTIQQHSFVNFYTLKENQETILYVIMRMYNSDFNSRFQLKYC